MTNNYQFPNVLGTLAAGNQSLSKFDTDFDASARMGTLMCSVAGTNSITLTALSGYPQMATYGNYQKIGFIATNTTTSLTTIGVSGLSQVNAYRSDGVTQIGSGGMIAGTYYEYAYNSALNAAAGGWQLTTTPPVTVNNIVYGQIAGCLPTAVSGTSTTAAITVSSGQATDTTNAAYIVCAGYSWAVSSGNNINGYQGGTTLPNSSTIHFYVCTGGSGTGTFASLSLTPTLPAGYDTYYRRIFSLQTNGSGAPLGGTPLETEGGSLLFYLTTQVLDISTTSLISANRTLFALSVPGGIKVQPLYRFYTLSTAGLLLTSPDETDVLPAAASATGVPLNDMANAGAYIYSAPRDGILTTNTSSQIGLRASSGTGNTAYLTTRGWKDFRRS